jgi:hypothetical protein
MNDATGGDEVTSGVIDVPPAVLDLLWGEVTGAPGQDRAKDVSTVGIRGRARGDAAPAQHPRACSGSSGEPSEGQEGQTYRENVDETRRPAQLSGISHYRKAGEADKARALDFNLLRTHAQLQAIDRRIQALRRAKRAIPDLDARVKALQTRANRLVAAARRVSA